MRYNPSLLRSRPALFSPLYLNADKISTTQLLAIYRFANLFFPKFGPGAVHLLLDMERDSGRLRAGIAPEERRSLISDMKGVSMDIQCTLKGEGQKMLELSIHIVPSEVLHRTQQDATDFNQYRRLRDDFDKLIVTLIEKEVRRRFTAKVENLLRDSLGKPHIPPLVSRLLDMGWINSEGRLMEGAAIDDLLTGKNRAKFERLAPEELIREGRHIRETILACFAIGAEVSGLLMQDVQKRHALLEITIRAAQGGAVHAHRRPRKEP